MKVAICYTPLASARGKPLLSQNRQFQWYSGLLPYAVYPVVMAAAATLMQKKGHEVFWMDYIAENKSYEEFVKDFVKTGPKVLRMSIINKDYFRSKIKDQNLSAGKFFVREMRNQRIRVSSLQILDRCGYNNKSPRFDEVICIVEDDLAG